MAARGIDITGVPFGELYLLILNTAAMVFYWCMHYNGFCYMYLFVFVVVNVTLPDDKQNYVHRIGRVGRADRMGLAISLVATVKEKVIIFRVL